MLLQFSLLNMIYSILKYYILLVATANVVHGRVIRTKRESVLDRLLGFISNNGGVDAQFSKQNTLANWRNPNQFDLWNNQFNGVLGTGWKSGWGATGGQLGGGYEATNSIPFLGEGNLWTDKQRHGWDMTNFRWDGTQKVGVGPWDNSFSSGSTFALPVIPNAIAALGKKKK